MTEIYDLHLLEEVARKAEQARQCAVRVEIETGLDMVHISSEYDEEKSFTLSGFEGARVIEDIHRVAEALPVLSWEECILGITYQYFELLEV